MRTEWELKPFERCIEPVKYTNKVQRKDFLNDGRFPIVSQEAAFTNGYWNDEKDVFRVSTPVVIFGDHTQVLKYVDFDFVLGADGVKILQPRDFLLPKFFFYQLQAANIVALGYARHYRLLKEMEIGVPPLPEQQRIVGILDEAFEGLATAKANAEKNLQNARAIFESELNAIFTKEGNDKWPTKLLGNVCDFEGGSQPPKSQFSYAPKDGYVRFLQIRDFGSDKHITFIPESKKNRLCNDSDVMIGRYGASVGKILTGKAGAYNVALMKAIPNPAHLDTSFLYKYLLAGSFQQRLAKVAARSAQNGFSKEDIYEFPVPVPPFHEQKQLVEALNGLRAETQRLESIYQRKLSELNALKKSLLHHAFTGHL